MKNSQSDYSQEFGQRPAVLMPSRHQAREGGRGEDGEDGREEQTSLEVRRRTPSMRDCAMI